MNDYAGFAQARECFREYAASLAEKAPYLAKVQQTLVDADYGGKYTVERPVVYNDSLDAVTAADEVKIILVGDNPGRREQETGRYLIGPSGKLAENFFRDRPALGIDFRKNVLILNKTPVHTPRTADLKKLAGLCGTGSERESVASLIRDSQRGMVSLLGQFYAALRPVKIWVVGYSEMKKGGLFAEYTKALFETLPAGAVYLYRHFSMNQFLIDFNGKARQFPVPAPGELAGENGEWEVLRAIGEHYRERIRQGFAAAPSRG
ncbi:MAG: uracil-DNA glycosylase family protein [Spirochaetaceae bacterium]|nr:uracil-DNA glycosylase family protein [Spirochaetaceae bacterium]